MSSRWLIIADDLTGASDCAVAFAQGGFKASVIWDGRPADDTVVAIETDSRRLPPLEARERQVQALASHHHQDAHLFKKIDSTLRGQPAAEVAAVICELRLRGHRALSVVAPAFPATGRTTVGGRMHLHDQALEETTLWARDHSYANASLVDILAREGLRVALVDLAAMRAGPESLAARLQTALDEGSDCVVCDATTTEDLDALAAATRPLARHVFWTGSGGLAHALARRDAVSVARQSDPLVIAGGILFVVGSIAEASRAAAAGLAADERVRAITLSPDVLRGDRESAAWVLAARSVTERLAAGGDILVEIEAGADVDLSQGAYLAERLAEMVQPAAPHIGALFITGGETALALLRALGVTGIRLMTEIESGVPLGMTRGALRVPVVTKAGAFGDAGTLVRCLSHLRHLRPLESSS